jgi:hypothetical protein
MRYLICTLLFLFIPLFSEAADFQWSQGQPAIVEDNTPTSYYCWTSGQPSVCYQYQSGSTPTSATSSAVILKGNVIFKGNIIIK